MVPAVEPASSSPIDPSLVWELTDYQLTMEMNPLLPEKGLVARDEYSITNQALGSGPANEIIAIFFGAGLDKLVFVTEFEDSWSSDLLETQALAVSDGNNLVPGGGFGSTGTFVLWADTLDVVVMNLNALANDIDCFSELLTLGPVVPEPSAALIAAPLLCCLLLRWRSRRWRLPSET